MSAECAIYDGDGVTVDADYFSLRYSNDFAVPRQQINPFMKGGFQKCLVGTLDLETALLTHLGPSDSSGTTEQLLSYWNSICPDHNLGTTRDIDNLKAIDLLDRPGTAKQLIAYWHRIGHYVDPNVLQDIANLRKKGVRCYLGTNNDKTRTDYFRDKMGLGDVFDGFLSSAELGVRKPNPEFFEKARDILGVRMDKILLIDDSKENIEAAIHSGMQGYHYKGYTIKYQRMLAAMFGYKSPVLIPGRRGRSKNLYSVIAA